MANDKETQPDSNTQAPNVCTFSLPMMMSALHQKAVKMVNEKFSKEKLKISNSAIEGEGKNAKLTSAGEHIICVTSSEQGEEIYRGDAIGALTTYVTWFAGPDVAKEVNEKTVMDLVGKSDEDQQGKDRKEDDDQKYIEGEDLNDDIDAKDDAEDDAAEEAKVKKESINKKIKFSLITDGNVMTFKNFLKESIIGEADDQQDTKKTGDLEDDAAEGKSDESSQGYYIAYNLKVAGLKESKLKDSMTDLAKGLFDSLTITASGLFGGGGVSFTGKDIRKKLNELINIDTAKLVNDVKTFLKKRYPQTEVDVYERDGSTLYKELNRGYLSQLDKDQKSTIQDAPYSICIKVKEKDIAKSILNARKIAEAIRKCISFFKFGSKISVDADSIIVINDYIDKRSQDEADANKRPSYSKLDKIISSKYESESHEGGYDKPISIKDAREVVENIQKAFRGIRTNKKALDQEENKKAIACLEKYEKTWEKMLKEKSKDWKFANVFKPFLEDYDKLKKELKKESIDALDKYGIAKMLFEQLFGDHDAFSQLICEKVPFEKLGKMTSKISQLHQDGKLKYPKASILDKDGKSTGQTKEIGDKEIANGLQYGILEFDEKSNQLKVTDKKGLRIEADGTLLTPNEEKRKYGDLMSDEDDKADDENDKGSSDEDNAAEDNEESSGENNTEGDQEENSESSTSGNESRSSEETTNSNQNSGDDDSNDEDSQKKQNDDEGSEGTVLYIYPVKNSNKLDDGMED